MTPLAAQDVVARLKDLPALQPLVMQLMQAIDAEDSGTALIAEKIGRDQALAAKTLRLANSSFYGFSGRIHTIDQAIRILGLNTVKSLALAGSVSGWMRSLSPGPFDMEAFWRHSLVTAMCARAVAARLPLDADTAFATGLLHDIGRLAITHCYPDHFAQVERCRRTAVMSYCEAERAVLGTDHVRVGQLLLETWKLPLDIREAVGQHHSPPDSKSASLSDVVHVADVIAHALDVAGSDDELVPPLVSASWKRVKLDAASFSPLLEQTESRFEQIAESLA